MGTPRRKLALPPGSPAISLNLRTTTVVEARGLLVTCADAEIDRAGQDGVTVTACALAYPVFERFFNIIPFTAANG